MKTLILTAGAAMVAAFVVVALMLATGDTGQTERAHASNPCPNNIVDKDGKSHPVSECDDRESTATHTVNLTNPAAGVLTCTGAGSTRIAKGFVGDSKSTDPAATPPKPTPNAPNGLDDIQTEIVSMNITGLCQPGNVPYTMTESKKFNSSGFVQEKKNNAPGVLEFPAASTFNVYVDVDVPSLGLVFHNQDPVQMFCQVNNLPPIGCVYSDQNLPVALHSGDPNDPGKKLAGQIISPATHELLPKPAATGNLTGIYDVQVAGGTVAAPDKNVGLFHCIARVDHDQPTDEIKAALQCNIDTPGQQPGSPLKDGADLVPGPPPPPPYGTASPTKAFGSYDSGTDTATLTACFENAGGALGPNIIAETTIANAKAGLGATGIMQGSVLIYANQSIADCKALTPQGTPPDPVPANFHLAGSAGQASWRSNATDFDGDGCTDFEELDKTGAFKCGDDPYNPYDADADGNGPISVLATSIRADWDKVNDELIPGAYFYCLGHSDHNLTTNAVVTTVVCQTDSPLLAQVGGSAVPSSAVGLPGAPVPPPFGSGLPSVSIGSYDPITNKTTVFGCFPNSGGATAPNVITKSITDIHTGEGAVEIYFGQSITDCNARTPNGDPSIIAHLQVAAQDPGWDSDNDGCSDSDEVLGAPKCGDDPYSPFDSDDDVTGPGNLLVTVVQADTCTGGKSTITPDPCHGPNGINDGGGNDDLPDKTLVGGSYFHCITDTQGPDNDLEIAAYCYTDNQVTTVNCEDAGNGPKVNPALCDPLTSFCDPPVAGAQPPSACGDGLPGSAPPAPYGDVDDPHTVLSGFYDPNTNTLNTAGCFEKVENFAQGPSVYSEAIINGQTGQGTVDIWLRQTKANCLAGTPDGTPDGVGERFTSGALIQTVEQPAGWDTDQDNCTNTQELRNPANAGGVRDPYNRWDWMDQWINGKTDGSIVVGDIGAVVARFGTVGTPGDPKVPPVDQFGYDTQADRGGALVGSAGPWNLKAPDGSIVVGDIGAVVAQFGHAGCAGKNP